MLMDRYLGKICAVSFHYQSQSAMRIIDSDNNFLVVNHVDTEGKDISSPVIISLQAVFSISEISNLKAYFGIPADHGKKYFGG